jgi:histidyl-tRNA synthetase
MDGRGTIAGIKGFRDVLPAEAAHWRRLEDAAAEVFGRYGFGEIRVPLLERTELFARSIGESTDIVEKEMYAFADRDRDASSLALRPEATAGVVRACIEHGLVAGGAVTRLWYAGPMFRRERPQRGRYRQVHQIGVELLGRDDPLADVELLVMLMAYLRTVGARDVRLELNSLGDDACRPGYRERLRAYGAAHHDALCGDCHRRLERNPLLLLDCKVPGCREVMAGAPTIAESLCSACREHFAEVRRRLEQTATGHEVAPRLVRGLDYYARTTFEVSAGGLGAQSALAGGGRYDGLVALLGGASVAGVGFAIGVERLAMAAGHVETAAGPIAVILPLAAEAVDPALALATRLRDEGLWVGLEPPGRSLRALLRAADRQRARLAVIVGADELAAGRATVRDLARHEDHRAALALDAPGAALAARLRAWATEKETSANA